MSEQQTVSVERTRFPLQDPAVDGVSAAIHHPVRPSGRGVLLTHGAGGDLDGEGLVALAEALADLGHPTVRANLPHREAGRTSVPRAERSLAPYRQLLEVARDRLGLQAPLIAGGKSYGGRVASLVAAEGVELSGLLFYGYPLHPPGKPEKLRTEHWPQVPVPALFLQGTRDPFCDLALLDAQVRKLPRRATVHVVEGGDHSLKVTGAASPDGRPHSAAHTIASLREVLATWSRSLDE